VADGLIDLEVTAAESATIRCVVRVGGKLGSRKNVNVPGVRARLPAVTERDVEHLLKADARHRVEVEGADAAGTTRD
jgi:pyruvate kinase